MDFKRLLYVVLSLSFLFVSFQSLYAMGWQVESILKSSESSLFSLLGCVMLSIGLLVFFISVRIRHKFTEKIAQLLLRGSTRQWLWLTISGGVILRLAWVLLLPSEPISDGATYIALAKQLYTDHTYGTPGALAYWPAGFPLLLSIFQGLPFETTTIISSLNILMYIATSLILYNTVTLVLSEPHARLTLVLLTLWPNSIALAGDASKEAVLITLTSLMTYAVFKLIKTQRVLPYSLFIGLPLGLMILIQPSFTLFISAIFFTYLTIGLSSSKTIASTVLVLVTFLITVSPWTIRNYQVFDEFVLVSSNGGFNFYRANNEEADGRYLDEGPVKLSQLPELEQSKEGFRLGKQWIIDHPQDFLLLAVRKQLLFLGEDGPAIYTTLKRGGGTDSDTLYLLFKIIALIFWFLIWLSILMAYRPREPITFTFFAFGFLYLYSIHSVFESGTKYHTPVVIFLIVLAACAWLPKVPERINNDI